MESLKGGVSFKVNFINSGDNPGNSSGESQRLIGVYDGDWSLGDDGTVNASMTFARRAGDVRSHGNLMRRSVELARLRREYLFQNVWVSKTRV